MQIVRDNTRNITHNAEQGLFFIFSNIFTFCALLQQVLGVVQPAGFVFIEVAVAEVAQDEIILAVQEADAFSRVFHLIENVLRKRVGVAVGDVVVGVRLVQGVDEEGDVIQGVGELLVDELAAWLVERPVGLHVLLDLTRREQPLQIRLHNILTKYPDHLTSGHAH